MVSVYMIPTKISPDLTEEIKKISSPGDVFNKARNNSNLVNPDWHNVIKNKVMKDGMGQNKLGELLMELRNEFKNSANYISWIGVVSGDKDDITRALETFRDDKVYVDCNNKNDIEMVAKLIRKQRQELFEYTMKTAHEAQKINFYG
jgi:hypothetical protein